MFEEGGKRKKLWICYTNIGKHLVWEIEIGTCPNIEVEINVTDKSTIFYKAISC